MSKTLSQYFYFYFAIDALTRADGLVIAMKLLICMLFQFVKMFSIIISIKTKCRTLNDGFFDFESVINNVIILRFFCDIA